jgi:hypothetical protein
MSLASLKRTIRNIEQPVWVNVGGMMAPNFGVNPDLYMRHIIDWVGTRPHPETWGCYALWRITHQQARIEQLEDIVYRLIGEVEKLKEQAYTVSV